MYNFFHPVKTEEEAYLLGRIASDNCAITKESIAIQFHPTEKGSIEKITRHLNPIFSPRTLTITSPETLQNVCKLLDIEPQTKSAKVNFPDLDLEELSWAFLRGYFDGDGDISSIDSTNSPQCQIATSSNKMKAGIKHFCKIKSRDTDRGLVWYDNNAIDFLGKLYDKAKIYLPSNRELYLDWASWVPALSGEKHRDRLKNFRWAKSHPNAFPPFKQRVSDSGFDLTLIEMVEEIGNVQIYDTGIKVQPEYGWYFIIAPRSSLFKKGYIPAITTGIIDRTYVGSIKVPLIKFDPNAPDLELPYRAMQIIPTPIVHVDMLEVDDLEETNRGTGGLGSSGDATYPDRV